MVKDSIIKEIHQIRSEYAEKFGNDLHAICVDARKKQGIDGRPVVSAKPKPVLSQSMKNNVA